MSLHLINCQFAVNRLHEIVDQLTIHNWQELLWDVVLQAWFINFLCE